MTTTTTRTALRLTIDPGALSAALQAVTRAISTRTTLPILNNVLLEATKEGLSLTATNLEIGIRKLAPAEVIEPGATTVPAKLLADFVATLPPAPLSLTMGEGRPGALGDDPHLMTLECGRFETHIRCIDAAEFPPGPRPDGGDRLTLPREGLLHAIECAAIAASSDEARPVLTGMLMALDTAGLTLVATDGHRLVERKLRSPEDWVGIDHTIAREGARLIVPARALAELPRAFKGETDVVEMVVSPARNQVFIRCGSSEVTSRLIDGQYPNYAQVILPSHTTTVRLKTAALVNALRPIAVFAVGNAAVIRLMARSGELVLSSRTQDVGDGRVSLEAAVDGDDVEMAFNARYLLDALTTVGEEVVLRLGGPLSPAVIVGGDDADGLCVVMPVRVAG
jgi:DNA polymerase-3 subunit beta